MRHFTRWLPIVLLPVLFFAGSCYGQFEEGRAGGTQPTVISLNQFPTPAGMGMATYTATMGSTNRKIKNVIWFKINEQATMPNGQPIFFKSPFTATVTFDVTTVDKNNVTATQAGKTLTVNYETDPAKPYNAKSYLVLNPNDYDGYNSVTIKATNLNVSGFTNWNIPSITGILSLENEMQVLEYFQNPNFLPPNFSVPIYDAGTHPDILPVSWSFPAGANNNMCQLEYAYVEDETAAYYKTNGQLDYNSLFLNNSTRVDITTNSYNIPMLYDGAGKLYYRVRPVMRRNTGNMETGNWTTPQTYPQSGSYPGHEPYLNWQATTSFAEEQKSKTVVQYFDGTLRGRQTVTKDNSTGNTVVAETIYDLQGRPNVQILPTPTLGTAMKFFKDFNRFDGMTASTDNPAHYFDLSVAGAQCNGAPKLQTTQGNGQYYSRNNPWNPSPTNPNSEANAAFIPDAQGYAYTETKLMDDPTGRVEAQGGVGINHQLGSGHETRYFYGKPDQDELDALFGTEVGYAEHYFKNMVQDANGQMSVSYVDMHGRTVATALAGDAPASGALQPIKNNTTYYPPSAGKLTKNLAEPANNTVKGHSIESINTLLVPTNTVYNFTYDLRPDVYQKNGCSQNLCFDCKYDLEINIRKEGCDNNGPTAYTYRYNNLASMPSATGQCGTPMLFVGGNIDGREQLATPSEKITFDKNLSAGSWIVTKTLTINEAAFQARHDLALNAFLCETEQDIASTIFAATGCDANIPTATANCTACKALLGTSFNNAGDPTSYVQRYMGYMALPTGATLDATSIANLQKQYDADVLSCGITCGTATDPRANAMVGIRSQMLRDMIPYSGQFALATEDPAAHPLSAVFNIFGSTTAYNGIQGYSVPLAPHPLYKNPSNDGVTVSTYKDENIVSDPTMTPVILAGTTPDLFVNAFNPSWANQLIAYHPEYKKLQLVEGALKPSFDYAQAFQSCTTYALANSAANNFLHPLASDPYFTYVPADYLKMNSYLSVGTNGITIWSLANAAALCPTDISTTGAQNARAACIQSMPTTGISPQITATADLDNVWETFKGMYLGQRNNLVMTYINTQSTASSSLPPAAMAQLISEGKSLHFLNNADAASQGGIGDIWTAATATPQPDLTTLANLGNARASGQNAKVCAALKPLWKSELQQCEAIRALLDQDAANDNSNNQATVDGILNNITSQMEQVCLLSIDADNPNGATTVSPPNMLASPNNFEQIVRTAFANAGMSPTINGNFLCNPYTINVPKPYGKNLPNADTYSPSVSSCNCDQWAKIKAEIAAATTGGPYDITSLTSVNGYLLANYGDVLSAGLWNGLQQCTAHDWQKTVCYPTTAGSTNTTSSANNSSTSNSGGQTCYTVPNPIIIGTDQNPVYIPVFLGCSYVKPCMSCVQLVQYTADFVALYPFYLGVPFALDANTTDAQQSANNLWARYINYKTGFSLTASVYANALASCNAGNPGSGGGLCVSDLQLTDRNAQPPAQTTVNGQPSSAKYIANTSITFLPGYTSQDNDNFIAQIAPCTTLDDPSTTAVAVCYNTFAANHVPTTATSTIAANPCQKQLDDAAAAAYLIIALRATYYKAQFDAQYLATCLGAKDHELFTAAYTPSEYHYTLYYYNQAGNLVKTVPPAGVHPDYSSGFLSSVKTARDAQPQTNAQLITPSPSLITSYRHNSLNKPVAQNSPDGGTSYIWYDRLGRMAVSQNAKQAAAGNYSYTLYDVLNRVTGAGQTMSTIAINQSISQDDAQLNTWLVNTNANKEQITNTIFDLPYAPIQGIYITQTNLRNRVSYIQTFNSYGDETNGNAATATYYTYDPHGNINTLLQDYNLLTGMNVNGNRFKRIVYDYDLISGKVNQVSYQPPVQTMVNGIIIDQPNPDAFYHRYTYDAENRITGVETSRDNILWTRDTKYGYYRHGPLAQLLLGRLRIQELNYSYTVQGWMKGTNLFGNTQNDMVIARNAYSSALGYFDGDYKAIGGTTPQGGNLVNLLGSNAAGLYNGNIAAQAINIPKLGSPLVYGYKYDQLNRLVGSDAYQAADDNYSGLTALNDYKERLSYDPNGNIQTYLRNGTGSSTILNDYRYSYSNQLSQNQLTSIFNSVNGTTYNYAYDQIGNVTKDDKQGVTNAVWNVYGKLQTVTKADGTTITYTYSPDLQRASKKVGNVSEFYVRDATGNLMATYKKDPALNNGDLTLTETYKYGSSLLSINTQQINVEHPATNAVTTFTAGNDGYQVTDQNGNTRLVLSDKKTQVSLDGVTVDHYEAVVNTANHFSAFGAISKSIGNVSVLGFNGQRKSLEIGADAQTAEFWEYNSDVGRRWNVDPIYKHSPYECFGGNPVAFGDKNGADTINLIRTRTTYSHQVPDNAPDAMTHIIRKTVVNSGEIKIKAGGDNIFSITDVNTTVDDYGNSSTTSKTTQLNLNDEQNYNMSGGHNMKGEIDDRYALAKAAPAWLLNYYAGKSAGWEQKGIQSAIAYQKDLPFASALNSTMSAIYTVSGIYGIAKFGLVAALESKTINVFGARGGYGLFGEEGIKIGDYKLEAMYSNGPGRPGGTLISIKQMKNGGDLLRWDYGLPHSGVGEIGVHSHFRFNLLGNTFGSSAQYGAWDPFIFWKFKK